MADSQGPKLQEEYGWQDALALSLVPSSVGHIHIHFREPLTFKLKLNRVMVIPLNYCTHNEMKIVIELNLCSLNKSRTVKVPNFTSKNFHLSTEAVAIQDLCFCHN
ncbi:hypothetical protein ACET3Z_010699 [Daucus carota]